MTKQDIVAQYAANENSYKELIQQQVVPKVVLRRAEVALRIYGHCDLTKVDDAKASIIEFDRQIEAVKARRKDLAQQYARVANEQMEGEEWSDYVAHMALVIADEANKVA